MPKKRKAKAADPIRTLKDFVAYHGTAAMFLSDILSKGLVPQRKLGLVYFSPLKERAETYAKSWAVGMHAGGATKSPCGSVLSFPLRDDDELHQEQSCDFAVYGSVAPTDLREESYIDLSHLSQDTPEYMGYLLNFIGVAGWTEDAYHGRNPFEEVLRRASECYDHLHKTVPGTVLVGMMSVPVV